MLAYDEEGDTPAAPRFSLATDIVELVVLTADEAFLQTLREAVGGARRLWHVLSADKVSDHLVAGEVSILVLDVQCLNEAEAVFVGQIKRQFPDLVVVVAGNRDAETSLAGLISTGIVYRFIHKPMSPGRAKLFADAAVRKYEEQRSRAAAAPVRRGARFPRGILMGGTIGALGVVVVASWALHRDSGNDAAPPHAADAHAQNPADEAAHAGLAEIRERLLAKAENALLEERLDEAAAVIETARQSGVESGRIAFLRAQLANSREQIKTAKAAARTRSEPKAGNDEGTPLLELAAQRFGDDRLVEPADDSALFYIRQALQLDPDSDAAQEAEKALAMRLLKEAHDAIDRRDFAHASAWLEAATGVASPANIDAVQALLATARRQVDTDADAQAQSLQNATQRMQQDPLVEPADDRADAAPHGGDDDAKQRLAADVIAASDLTLVKSASPVYPKRAESNQTQGWVELDFTVAENGSVKDVAVHAASAPGVFDAAAISALLQWRYKPVLRDAKPVAQRARIRIRFALAN